MYFVTALLVLLSGYIADKFGWKISVWICSAFLLSNGILLLINRDWFTILIAIFLCNMGFSPLTILIFILLTEINSK